MRISPAKWLIMGTATLALIACSKAKTDEKAPITIQVETKGQVPDIAKIHDRALIIDTHIDLELPLIAEDFDPWSSGKTVVNLDKMEKGGMDGAFLIVYTPQGPLTDAGIAEARAIAEKRYKAINRLVEKYPKRIERALSPEDARRIEKAGKRVEFIGMENAYPLGNSVEDVPMWAKRGVRYMGITHMGHNQFGDSSNPSYARGDKKEKWGGLSPLGKELIKALNDNGIIVDVSHAAKSTMMQAVALSKVPVIASHSGIMGVAENVRNLDDEQLKALAAKGGVVQIVAYGGYLKNKTPEQKAFEMKVRKEMGLEDDMAFLSMDEKTERIFDEKMTAAKDLAPPANISDLVDHIDYTVKLIGVDHVGIASDFDGGGKIPGWMDPSETMNITRELVKRGYSEADIDKILGGNVMRVLGEVEAYAAKQARKE